MPLRKSLKKDSREKYTFKNLEDDIKSKEESRTNSLKYPQTLAGFYDIKELEEMKTKDFLNEYDSSISADTNLENVMKQETNPKSISNLKQRHKNPKWQSYKIE